MTATVTKLEENKVKLEVEVPAEKVREGVEAKVRELRKQVRVPGFRPGKAPRRMIENHVGRDYIYMEALQESLPNWYSEAVVDADIRPIDRPEINFDDGLDEKEGFRFSATVEVRPSATLGEYRGVEAPRREVAVEEEQVEQSMTELRDQFATLAAVEDRAAKGGDFAVIDFKGELMTGGELPGGDAEDFMLEIGQGKLLKDFEDNLVGMQAGERKQFAVTFPMDYQEQSLRGQSVLFRVHLKEIKEKDLPELDDDFAMEASEFETLEELRGAMREQLQARIDGQIEGEFRNAVLEVVAGNAEVEVPAVMVSDKANEMVRSFERNMEQRGIKAEQYYQIAGMAREDFITQVRPDAEDTVKKELVLDAIVEAENLEADPHDIEHEMFHVAEETGRSVEEVTATMKANGTYALMEEELARAKALEFLSENATATPMPEEPEEADTEGAAGDEVVAAETGTETRDSTEEEK
ncbi:trigger factor [Rubrobacter indicoceani]|uniref:trigger factor n=1 Tax=Rubrobacter indicoceani TaxID=2051957 RepID=UPI000E5B716C|nr:trigger factor [Rubrobacter indicoceani]